MQNGVYYTFVFFCQVFSAFFSNYIDQLLDALAKPRKLGRAWSLPIFSRTVGPCSACPESVGSTDPTVLPARKVVLALMYAPLDNHKIAFGCIHFALHLFSQRCVRRWGRYCPRLHVARRRHFGASPLRQRSLFRRKIAHPSAYAGAWPGSEYLHSGPCTRLCGVCTIPPLSESPALRLMHLVRPRYSS